MKYVKTSVMDKIFTYKFSVYNIYSDYILKVGYRRNYAHSVTEKK